MGAAASVQEVYGEAIGWFQQVKQENSQKNKVL